jgi:hypothetical protein
MEGAMDKVHSTRMEVEEDKKKKKKACDKVKEKRLLG